MKLEKGFYTALGTPLTESGELVAESLTKHIEQQIAAGASGLLLMGSMGIEAFIKNSAYAEIVKTGVAANAGRLPLFVGVMDNSVAKVMEKIEMIGKADITGVVLTTPFYSMLNFDQLVNWFTIIADRSPYPVYLYDLAVVTKIKITLPLIDKLINHTNIKYAKVARREGTCWMRRGEAPGQARLVNANEGQESGYLGVEATAMASLFLDLSAGYRAIWLAKIH